MYDGSAEAAAVPSYLEEEDGASEAYEDKRAEHQERTGCEPCPTSRGRCDDTGDEGAAPREHASGAPCQPCGVELGNHQGRASTGTGGVGGGTPSSEREVDMHAREGDRVGAARDGHEHPQSLQRAPCAKAPVWTQSPVLVSSAS